MSRRSFLLDLKAEGALSLWHDYRRNHDAIDLSGNANNGTFTGNVYELGRGLQVCDSSSHILVANAASNQLTEGTFIVYTTSMFRQLARYQDLIIKRSVSVNYEMYIAPTGALGCFDGGLNTTTVSVVGKRYLALNMKNGEEGEVYHDGVFIETLPGGNLTVATTTDPVSILSGNPSSAQFTACPIEAAIIVNRKLTATEHAKLYGELANQDWGQRVL